ncbi:MAG: N-acetylmuramoyl-L-alanine amidase [Clostridia bacterium]|nr:N-acetylmuramoyl-L-alanine amidase [Clostridia bacterium]
MKASAARRRYLSDFFFFALIFAMSSVFVFAAALRITGFTAVHTAADTVETSPLVIVLDPGHGGEDGGASGADGTVEKDLNLTVAKAVGDILTAAGYDVRLTRTDDRLLYDLYGDLSDYTGHKKTYDLRNRLRFAREADADLFVSIHMNKFPEEKYKGLQVYYSPGAAESQTIADTVQNYAKLYLQKDNTRVTKRSSSAIYLLSRAEMPAIMIECGFLSNEAELQNLTDSIYQKQLALTIAAAIAESTGEIGA